MTQSYCSIYLVRHGETEWNVSGLMQGQADSPLTPKGVKQAKSLAKQLRTTPFTAVRDDQNRLPQVSQRDFP